MRLGVVGLASSHVDQVLRLVAVGALGADVRVVALGVPDAEPVDAARVSALLGTASRGRAGGARSVPDEPGPDGPEPGPDAVIPEVTVGSPDDLAAALAGRVDAVLVTTRDARTHRRLADPLLRAGMPLLVDKPFTADPEDAVHLVRLADRLGVPLTSSSALRWHPGTQAARERWADEPGGLAVAATGPADPQDPHGGLATYAVHTVEAALTVLRTLPDPEVPITVSAGVGLRTASVRAGRDLATITVVTPRGGEQTPFHVAVAGAVGRSDAQLVLGAHYLLPVLRTFVGGVAEGRRGRVGPTGDALVATVRVTAALAG